MHGGAAPADNALGQASPDSDRNGAYAVRKALMAIKLLIVDDHPMMRHALRRLFSGTEIEVAAEADTGAAALQVAVDRAVDAVLLDLHLPDGPSLAVLEQIKSAKPNLHVFMHSSDASRLWIDRCRRAGADEYFIKGQEIRRLLAVLQELASRMTPGADGQVSPSGDNRPKPVGASV